jgi:hypothetical protein
VEVDVEVQASGKLKVVGSAVYFFTQNCYDCNVFTGVQVYEVNEPVSFRFPICYLNIIMLHITTWYMQYVMFQLV